MDSFILVVPATGKQVRDPPPGQTKVPARNW